MDGKREGVSVIREGAQAAQRALRRATRHKSSEIYPPRPTAAQSMWRAGEGGGGPRRVRARASEGKPERVPARERARERPRGCRIGTPSSRQTGRCRRQHPHPSPQNDRLRRSPCRWSPTYRHRVGRTVAPGQAPRACRLVRRTAHKREPGTRFRSNDPQALAHPVQIMATRCGPPARWLRSAQPKVCGRA
jgi:hypothetical protein